MGKLIKIVAKRQAMGRWGQTLEKRHVETERSSRGSRAGLVSLSLPLCLSVGLNCPLKEPPGANNCCHSRFSRGRTTTTITIRTAVLASDFHYARRSRARKGGPGRAVCCVLAWLTSWPIKVHCVLRESWVGKSCWNTDEVKKCAARRTRRTSIND